MYKKLTLVETIKSVCKKGKNVLRVEHTGRTACPSAAARTTSAIGSAVGKRRTILRARGGQLECRVGPQPSVALALYLIRTRYTPDLRLCTNAIVVAKALYMRVAEIKN